MKVRYIPDEEIASKANSLISDYEKKTPPPPDIYETNIEAIAYGLGLNFYYEPLNETNDKKTLGTLIAQEKVILIDSSLEPIGNNKSTNEKVLRFTIAHEVGHYVFHEGYDPVFYMTLGTKEQNRMELQANRFASNLLMPEAPFRLRYSYHMKSLAGDTIGSLSKDFNTSIQATKIRIKELSL